MQYHPLKKPCDIIISKRAEVLEDHRKKETGKSLERKTDANSGVINVAGRLDVYLAATKFQANSNSIRVSHREFSQYGPTWMCDHPFTLFWGELYQLFQKSRLVFRKLFQRKPS